MEEILSLIEKIKLLQAENRGRNKSYVVTYQSKGNGVTIFETDKNGKKEVGTVYFRNNIDLELLKAELAKNHIGCEV